MVPREAPVHKYFSGPQNYNPDIDIVTKLFSLCPGVETLLCFRHFRGPWLADGIVFSLLPQMCGCSALKLSRVFLRAVCAF